MTHVLSWLAHYGTWVGQNGAALGSLAAAGVIAAEWLRRSSSGRRQVAGYAVVGLLLVVNAGFLIFIARWYAGRPPGDYMLWTELPATGSPYLLVPYRASPVAAWLVAPVLTWIGPLVWAVLHGVVLLALPRRVAAVVAISAPFWLDVVAGNVFAFIFVAGYLAVRGSRPATLVYIVLTLLMPRPVQVPLLAWLLWKQPHVRTWFAALFAGHLVLVLLSGYAGDWYARLVETSGGQMEAVYNFGPTALVGYAWFVVAIPLAAWLWFRARPGLVGLVLSPYVLGQYYLFELLDPGHEPPGRPADRSLLGDLVRLGSAAAAGARWDRVPPRAGPPRA